MKKHKFTIGDLVELDNGVRLFVFMLAWDCDGTPLYVLTPSDDAFDDMEWYYENNRYYLMGGFDEDGMKLIKRWEGAIKGAEKFLGKRGSYDQYNTSKNKK